MKYIGIEGSSYTGKTTTGEALRRRGHVLIPEYDAFGPFPGSDETAEGLKIVIDELFARERRRTQILSSIAIEACVFSDRTPISFITFEDMKIISSHDKGLADVHRSAKDYALTELERGVQSGDILMPNRIAVLRIVSRTEFDRRVDERGVTAVTGLADFDMQHYIAARSLDYAAQFIGQENTHLVSVDNLGVDELADVIEDVTVSNAI